MTRAKRQWRFLTVIVTAALVALMAMLSPTISTRRPHLDGGIEMGVLNEGDAQAATGAAAG